MRLRSLSVLIPAYNVAGSVASVVRGAHRAGELYASVHEIIVIDDGSTDATAAELQKLAPSVRELKIINHDTNAGYGQTIKQLYEAGTKEWLFTLPGDGQFDASELTKLLSATTRADMVLGWRTMRHDPAARLFQSLLYNKILSILFGLPTHDVNTIRLMKKEIITAIPLESGSAFVDAELVIRARRHGFRISEVSVTHKDRRTKGATGGNFMKTILPTILDMLKFFLFRRGES